MNKKEDYLMSKWYVSMTDSFLSGWGPAKDKTNKLVFECDSYQEALRVLQYARCRGDMKYVYLCSTNPMPRFSNNPRMYPQLKTKTDYPEWYNATTLEGGKDQ